MPISPPLQVSHSLLNTTWDSLTCSVRSGPVKLSAAHFTSEHTQRSPRVKSSFTCSQKSFVIRWWVCVFRERPLLKASCIVSLSTSTTAVLPLRQIGWAIIANLSTSCIANVSLTLICALCYAAGKSAAALKMKMRRTVPYSGHPMLRTRSLWPLRWSEHARWCRTTAPRSAGSSPLTSHHFKPQAAAFRYCDRCYIISASGALKCNYLAVHVVCVQADRWYRYGHTRTFPC